MSTWYILGLLALTGLSIVVLHSMWEDM